MKKSALILVCLLLTEISLSQTTYTFFGNGYWSNAANWSGTIVPPTVLPAGSTIYISPSPGDSCVLDVEQSISPDANLVVTQGANFIISGGVHITGSAPIITTNVVSNITYNSSISGGNVIDDGGSTITSRGIVWDLNHNPTISNNKTMNGTGSGNFISNLSGLAFNKTYYIRAYAINNTGVAYGNEVTFTTLQIPSTVICNQEWTAVNLEVTTYRNGDSIPRVTSQQQWDTMTTGAWCYYNFYPENYLGLDRIGKFYNSYAVSDPRGLAPAGWHIPCDSEWTILSNCLGGAEVAGVALKDTAAAYWNSPNSGATNSSGFSATGAGRYTTGICDPVFPCGWSHSYRTLGPPGGGTGEQIVWVNSFKNFGYWWSNTESEKDILFSRKLDSDPNLYKRVAFKHDAYTVRCVKGDSNTVCSETLPVVSSDSVSTLGPNYAYCGGTVMANNIKFVYERGIVWDTLPNPTIVNNKDTAGSGLGHFTKKLTGLLSNKTYYLRAYAINSFGIAYGNEVTLATLRPILPTVATWFISNDQSNALAGGKVIDNGGNTVIARGVVWNTNINPTLADHFTINGTDTGTYLSNINGLNAGTTYYLKAYATNSEGTSYGNEIAITTGAILPASVIVCNQVWTQKNLDVTTYRNGDPIPQVTDSATWNSLTTGAWCWYNNDSAVYAAVYGRMYNWYAASDLRGIAPAGFHVPTNNEWYPLLNCLGTANYNTPASNAIREAGIMHWNSPNNGATNSSGFTALPGGQRYGNFIELGALATFWCSDGFEYGNNIEIYQPHIFGGGSNKMSGRYIRCIRDSFPTDKFLPVVSTAPLNAITATSSTGGGNISNDGGSPVTARGVTWNTSPTIRPGPGNRTSDGPGTGTFTSNITGLTANTKYYVWAYATNNVGTTYGPQATFKTPNSLVPVLTTIRITKIGIDSSVSGGIISNDYSGPVITARGIVWDVNPAPTITGNKTINGSGTGAFTSTLSGMLPNTVYYVRAYATNSMNTTYGNEITFKTLDPSIPSVSICDDVWMIKNLDVLKYRNGDPIPQVTDPSSWGSLNTGAWCWYNNDSATYAATYGKIYNWFAVNDPRGLAPTGWHIPNDSEWAALSTCLGGDAIAGDALKEMGVVHWGSSNISATNSSGFTGMPGGRRPGVGTTNFSDVGNKGYWWSSSNLPGNVVNIRVLTNANSIFAPYSDWRFKGCSVRCIRDQ